MRYRLLGRSGLRVSELFLGGTTFARRGDAGTASRHRRILATYAEAGGNVIDSASAYGDSEEVLGDLLRGQRDRFVLGTKYTLTRDPADPNAAGNHRKNMRLSLERSLRRLRTDYVDLFWVHIWDRHTPIEETMRALDDAVRAGTVLHVGISDAPAWLAAQANTLADWRDWTPFAAVQVPYNLFARDVERELLPMAEALGLTVAAWRTLARGVLGGRSTDGLTGRQQTVVDAVSALARDLGVTPAQVAIAWTRARHRFVHPIVAASDPGDLAEALAAVDVVLPADAVARLDAATAFEPGFLSDFIAEAEHKLRGPAIDGRPA